MGYSRDLCGYLRNIIGYVNGLMNDKSSLFGGLPEPDLLLTPGGGCVPVMKIFHAIEKTISLGQGFFRGSSPGGGRRYQSASYRICRI